MSAKQHFYTHTRDEYEKCCACMGVWGAFNISRNCFCILSIQLQFKCWLTKQNKTTQIQVLNAQDESFSLYLLFSSCIYCFKINFIVKIREHLICFEKIIAKYISNEMNCFFALEQDLTLPVIANLQLTKFVNWIYF